MAILTRVGCPSCANAKKMPSAAGYDLAAVPRPRGVRGRALGAIGRAPAAPQVFVDGHRVDRRAA